MLSTLHIFAGPSLPPGARGDLPGGPPELVWHPPAAHGDLLALDPGPSDGVLIVDGVYRHRPPIRHKEILALLRRGVTVAGASSMGALRAAELDQLGMIGYGQVYRWLSSGRLSSDAEVALTHGDADDGFRPYTIPLVSIRFGAGWLVRRSQLTAAEADAAVQLASDIHFSHRSERQLAEAGREAGLDRAVTLLLASLRTGKPGDVKELDARAAIASLSRGPRLVPRGVTEAIGSLPRSGYEARYASGLPLVPASAITHETLLAFAQLFTEDFPMIHQQYVTEMILARSRYRGGTDPVAVAVQLGAWPAARADRDEAVAAMTTPGERATLPRHELELRTLVRTFRLAPSNAVYYGIPEALQVWHPLGELVAGCEKALSAARLAGLADPTASAAVPGRLVEETFRQLWQAEDLTSEILDRGFTGGPDFRRAARPFVVAARALVARRDRESPDWLVGHAAS
jgi:hypothetical protein